MPDPEVAPTQLDLFLDSRAVALVNDALEALLARDAARAIACRDALRAESPEHDALSGLDLLCAVLETWPFPSASAAEVASTVARLESEVQLAARNAMGLRATAFLQPLWRELALAARAHDYDPRFPQAHCAGIFLRGDDAQAAASVIASIPDWESNCYLLHWACLAYHRLDGLETCRPPLFLLAWRSPERLPALLAELDDPLLKRDWREFQLACDWLVDNDTASAWFPAWYRIEYPSVAIALETDSAMPTAAAHAFFALTRLIDLEKRGHSATLIQRRGEFRDRHPELFSLYMERRKVGRG